MFTTTLRSAQTVAEGTMLFRLARPEGFDYRAGQTVDLTLLDPAETDAAGAARTLSLVSAPHEPLLSVATRMRDTAFKRSLARVPEGGAVSIDGPFGSFFLHENAARPAVFLAGGIGITPFYSMISDAAARGLPHALTLFYANRRPEDAAFLSELQKLANENPRFSFVPTMTGAETGAQLWSGERGRINDALLFRHLPEGAPVYYLAGPPAMVAAMRALLAAQGVSEDDIRFEEFAGY